MTLEQMALCPFGVDGDEPLIDHDGWMLGIRQWVWHGVIDRAVGEEVWPSGDWTLLDKHPPVSPMEAGK